MDVKLMPYEPVGRNGANPPADRVRQARTENRSIHRPGGGFEEEEVKLAQAAGFVPITLGKRILRTETAGLTVMSWLMYRLEEESIS